MSIWDCKTSKYFHKPEFNIYISISCDKNYNPQEIMKDIEEFESFMVMKYVKKETKTSWLKYIKDKLLTKT